MSSAHFRNWPVISSCPGHNQTVNNFERKKVAKCLVNIRFH